MKLELSEGWTLSGPTPMMHGRWYAASYYGRQMPLVLIEDTYRKWMIQNGKKWFPSAAEAIDHAVKKTGLEKIMPD